MVERLKKDLRVVGVPSEIINFPSFEFIFKELLELYNQFKNGSIILDLSSDFMTEIEFDNEDELLFCALKYDYDNTRLYVKMDDGKRITLVLHKEKNVLIKTVVDENINTLVDEDLENNKSNGTTISETSTFSLVNGLELSYAKETYGYKDGIPYGSEIRLKRMDNGYISRIFKTDSVESAELGGYVNVNLDSPLLTDATGKRFEDASIIPSVTERDNLTVPENTKMSLEAKEMIEKKLVSKEDYYDWEINYSSGLAYNTFNSRTI